MTSIISRLPVLVLNPYSQCNCKCAMCEIWKRERAERMSPEQFDSILDDIEKLGVEWVVFSGGEALLDRDLFHKAHRLRRLGVRTTLLSSGLLLGRYANQIVTEIDDVIVSLDGPPKIHDAIRGVPRAFELLAEGVGKIRQLRSGYPVSARCTVQSANCRYLVAAAEAAQGLGLKSISFLAADLDSDAFNRTEGRYDIAVSQEDLPELDAQLAGLESFGDFVAESPEKRERIARHFRAQLGLMPFQAPRCNAPWVSTVVESDGTIRPCFFHQPIGRLNGQGLLDILNGPAALAFRDGLHIDENPICKRCVCSLNWTQHVRN